MEVKGKRDMSAANAIKEVEKYGIFEIEMEGVDVQEAVTGTAVFKLGNHSTAVKAFKTENHSYAVRFSPEEEGEWSYTAEIAGRHQEGTFVCVKNKESNHGRVQTSGFGFQYADGARYIPIGTTCYAWIHQEESVRKQTLATLAQAPFNKVRMFVFPKSMPYNNNDPEVYPFAKREDGSWDVQAIEPAFWNKLDEALKSLMDLGIVADLILFHPYDKWGFSKLSGEDCTSYERYCIARYASYRNIWWSLANEYEMLFKKNEEWDELGEILAKEDSYGHPVSIHNMISPYPKRDWMTHVSIQSMAIDKVITWRKKYQLPVLIDECGYEGDLPMSWGSLTAFEMVHKFWWVTMRGGFCTHGETFHSEDEVLWWSKGGVLHGESAARIAFMKEILYGLPGEWRALDHAELDPNRESGEEIPDPNNPFLQMLATFPEEDRETFEITTCPMEIKGPGYFLEYFGGRRPCYKNLPLRSDRNYKIEVIDIWDMTVTVYQEGVSGNVHVELPGKEGMAVLVTEL